MKSSNQLRGESVGALIRILISIPFQQGGVLLGEEDSHELSIGDVQRIP
jgi:hypothetical protein